MKFSKKKNNFQQYFFLIIIIISLIFYVGYYFGLKQVTLEKFKKKLIEKTINAPLQLINATFFKSKEISINISFNNLQKILKSRDDGLNNLVILEKNKKWANAKINFDNNDYDAKIKLKGSMLENIEDASKIGFKIKIINDKSIFGLTEFSLQHPEHQNFISEFLFQYFLEINNLPFMRLKFINIKINGKNYGLYSLQENFSKEYLENNKFRENPIVGYDKEDFLEHFSTSQKLNYYSADLKDSFLTAGITVSNDKNLTYDSLIKRNTDIAVLLLKDFQKGKINPTNIFDYKKLAKLFAIKVLFGSENFDWRDIKFYYDPFKEILVPLGKEVNSDGILKDDGWWIKQNLENNKKISSNEKDFLNLFYEDEKFYKEYIHQLSKIKDINLNSILENDDVQSIINKLDRNYIYKNHKFDISNLRTNQKIIRQKLDNLFIESFINFKNLDIYNKSTIPVYLSGFLINKEQFKFNDNVYVKGRQFKKTSNLQTIDLKKDLNKNDYKKLISYSLNELENSDIELLFDKNITNTKKKFKTKINLKNFKIKKKKFSNLDDLFIINNNKLVFKSSVVDIYEPILIPEGYKLEVNKPIKINFYNQSFLKSLSPVTLKTKKDKIEISGKGKNNYFLVISEKTSILKNVSFTNLGAPRENSFITGAVTFYEGTVIIKNVNFKNNTFGDDYLNIVNSKIKINDIQIKNSFLDSLDVDFSDGEINNLKVEKSGNDGADFSMSKIILNNYQAYNISDKAVSAGEKSKIKVENAKVFNAKFGFVSKDNSYLKIKNSYLENTYSALAAYNKKPEFGGAEIYAVKTKFNKNKFNYLSENGSSIYLDQKLTSNQDKFDYKNF